MRDTSRLPILRPKLIALSIAACFAVSSSQLAANPTGPTVMFGSAGFATAGNVLTVTNGANAVIHWQGFSIGVNETTRFLQPSAASAVLNRVVGAGGAIPQSVIDGVLSSNGRVFLLNPMGVLFSSTARIDVAGLVASSLNLSDQDFQNGTLRFTEVPGAGGVANHGVIETPAGGRVFLIAPSVENSGVIRSPQGEIVLAAGKNVELVSEGSPFVTVRLTAGNEQAVNVGSLIAESGSIGVYGALVRNSGVAEASGAVTGAGGQIRFVATKDLSIEAGSRVAANGTVGGKVLLQAEGGTNLIAGTVEATGSSGRGGEVQALGVRVGLIGHGVIDASGQTGGGSVMVGGDFQGKNAEIQNAQRTLIGPDGVIRADARTSGDGGRVIVWADGDTRFYGSISARGGSQSGDGGFVETSAKGTLQAFGNVNIGAPNGKGGIWLLDPITISIVGGLTAVSGNCGGAYGDICFGDPPATTSSVGSVNINLALGNSVDNGSGTVEMQAEQDINLQTNLILTPSGGKVIARAGNNINLGANNLTTNGTAVELSANDNGGGTATGVGSITSTPGFGNITTNGASVELTGVSVAVGAINTTGGPGNLDTNVSVTSTNGVISTGAITTGNTTASNSYVYLSANGGGVTTGNITTGNSAEDSSVSIYSGVGGGNISTGSITTGNAVFHTGVDISTDNGTVTTGNITTGAAPGAEVEVPDGGEGFVTEFVPGYSNVYISASFGGVTSGNIVTGGASGDTSVTIYSGLGGGNIVTGSIATGNAGNDSRVDIDTDNGSVTTGNITTGAAGNESQVDIFANNGGVTTGNILTGNAGNDSRVDISSEGTGGNILTGSITTGNAGDSSEVTLSAFNGGVTTGNILTGNAGEESDSDVDIFSEGSGGNIITGSITTGSAGDDSSVDIFTANGSVTTGNITTGAAADSSEVTLSASNGGVTVTGNILTGSAGDDSEVTLSASNGGVTVTGNILTGSAGDNSDVDIDSVESGGNITITGSVTTGNSGDVSRVVMFTDGGSINVMGSITTGAAAADTFVDLIAFNGGVTTGNITTGDSSGCCGPFQQHVFIEAGPGDIVTGSITTRRMAPGVFSSGGFVTLITNEGRIIVNGSIDTRGANGISGAANFYGGSPGGFVSISRDGLTAPLGGVAVQVNGSIRTSGGNSFTDPVNGQPSHGKDGGNVCIGKGLEGCEGSPPFFGQMPLIGAVKVGGEIVTTGGAGGASTAAGVPGGDGGHGGHVTVLAAGNVEIGAPAVPDVFGARVIDTSGGPGGAGGPGASGGIGGNAGHITIDPTAILFNGAIVAIGGTPDGNGGDITLHTGTVAAPGNIFFVNAFEPQFDGILNGYANGPGGPGGLAGLVDIRGTILYVFLTSPPGFVGADVIRAVDELEKLQDPEPEGRSCKP